MSTAPNSIIPIEAITHVVCREMVSPVDPGTLMVPGSAGIVNDKDEPLLVLDSAVTWQSKGDAIFVDGSCIIGFVCKPMELWGEASESVEGSVHPVGAETDAPRIQVP